MGPCLLPLWQQVSGPLLCVCVDLSVTAWLVIAGRRVVCILIPTTKSAPTSISTQSCWSPCCQINTVLLLVMMYSRWCVFRCRILFTSQLVSLLVFHLTALHAMRTIQQPAWYWCAVVSWWQLLLSAVMVQRHKLFVCRAGYFGNIMSGEYAASFLLALVCLPVC